MVDRGGCANKADDADKAAIIKANGMLYGTIGVDSIKICEKHLLVPVLVVPTKSEPGSTAIRVAELQLGPLINSTVVSVDATTEHSCLREPASATVATQTFPSRK